MMMGFEVRPKNETRWDEAGTWPKQSSSNSGVLLPCSSVLWGLGTPKIMKLSHFDTLGLVFGLHFGFGALGGKNELNLTLLLPFSTQALFLAFFLSFFLSSFFACRPPPLSRFSLVSCLVCCLMESASNRPPPNLYFCPNSAQTALDAQFQNWSREKAREEAGKHIWGRRGTPYHALLCYHNITQHLSHCGRYSQTFAWHLAKLCTFTMSFSMHFYNIYCIRRNFII